MFKKLLIAVIGVAIVVGAIVYVKLGQFGEMMEAGSRMVPPPETVTSMVVEPAIWERTLGVTGTLSAVQGVTVSAETGGRVKRIDFESGARVEAGDVLVQLDTAGESAQLAAAEAAAALARTTLERRRELGKRQLVSPADIDAAAAQAKEAIAQVGVVRATMARKTIRAPFAGRLGLRQVNLGQILREGDAIVSLQTLDPIHVDFPVPQQDLPLVATGMAVRVRADAAPDARFDGQIRAISPEVDIATRQIRVRALVRNAQEQLRAGMFAKVEVVLPQPRSVLPIAASAVVYAPFGDSVFVIARPANGDGGTNRETAPDSASVSADGVASTSGAASPGSPDSKRDEPSLVIEQRFVRLGEARGDYVEVMDGLKAGEKVVTSGVFKLRSGMSVVIDNTLAPKPSSTPTPGRG